MMRELAVLRAAGRRMAANALKEVTWAAAAVASVFIVLTVLILIGAYFFFLNAFGVMLADPVSGTIIARYILESAFAVVFFLGVASFVISSSSLIFRSPEVRLLAPFPVDPLTVFVRRFTAAAAMSAWPVFFIGLPALAALGATLRVAAEYYLFAAIVLGLFTLLIAVIGGLLSFFFAWAGRRLSPGWFWLGEMIAALFALAGLVHRLLPHQLFNLFIVENAAGAAQSLARIDQMFLVSPGHVFVRLFSSLLPFGQTGSAAGAALLLAVFLAAASAALLVLANRAYLPLWQDLEEGGFLARPEDAPSGRPARPFPRLFRWRYGFLFEKDFLSFVRDSGETSRAGFLLIVLALYVMIMRGLAAMRVMGPPEMQSWVIALAFAAIGYFALTLGLRFVFPALSLEGKSAWIVWSSPLHLHEIYSWKLIFWSTAISLPLLLVGGLTVSLFGFPFWLGAFFLFAIICAVTALTSISLGQGCLYPNFRDRDPDTLSTSPAGLAATGLGLVYLAIVIRYVRAFALAQISTGALDIKSAFGILIVSWGVIAAYWVAAPRRLDRLEIPS